MKEFKRIFFDSFEEGDVSDFLSQLKKRGYITDRLDAKYIIRNKNDRQLGYFVFEPLGLHELEIDVGEGDEPEKALVRFAQRYTPPSQTQTQDSRHSKHPKIYK